MEIYFPLAVAVAFALLLAVFWIARARQQDPKRPHAVGELPDQVAEGTAARIGTSNLADQRGWPGRMSTVPKPYPQEFREDVVRVVRARETGVTLAQIAKDFGIHEMTLNKWMHQADIDDGNRPGASRSDNPELRELRRRNRLLEQENEVPRRAAAYLSQENLPGEGSSPASGRCPHRS